MNERLTRRRLKEISSLVHRKYRERLSEMLVEGKRSVVSALEADAPIVAILVTESAGREADVKSIKSRARVPVYVVSEETISQVSDVESSQGVLAVVRIETHSIAHLRSARRILVLDEIQDPGNAGTIVRTAAWFGAAGLITGPGTVDLYNPKAVRAAMGALWDLKHVRVDDLTAALSELRESGFKLYGADTEGVDVRSWRPTAKSVLVFGSEAHGLSEAASMLLDERIVIHGSDARQATESLNVAVAAGILLHEWFR